MMTIEVALQQGAARLKKAEIENPRFEAEVLLSAVLSQNRVFLYAHDQQELTLPQLEQYESGIRRRQHHEPVAYILGEKEFMGLPFKVSSSVLIPRPDTEILAETALQLFSQKHDSFKLLDLCTGSGAIGLSIAYFRPQIDLTLSDISPDALKIAAENRAKIYPAAKIIRGDLFDHLAGEKFDCIISNPPYIPSQIINTLEKDVCDYEPHLALDGGRDGFDFYDRIIAEAPEHLYPGGWLLLEAGDGQGELLMQKMKAGGFSHCFAGKDLIGVSRCIAGQSERIISSRQ